MPRTFEVPGQGPIDSLSVWKDLQSIDDFAALKKNGFSVPLRGVRLQGALAKDFEGDLMLSHHGAEQELASERVRDVKGGRYDVKVHLMRGRNTFFLSSSAKPDEVYRLDLFYRSTGREWVESILKALVLVLVVKTFVVQAFFIPTQSMETTLLVGDYLLVDKVSYMFRDPARGEIVVFEYPEQPWKDFIKRCVAVPGDQIAHPLNQLVLNGQPLREPYTQYVPQIVPEGVRDPRHFDAEDLGRTGLAPGGKVPDGHFFMMGDNRNNSQDSRWWGALPRWRLTGRAFASYFPPTRMGLISHVYGEPMKIGPAAPMGPASPGN